jgi:hypothetical protein
MRSLEHKAETYKERKLETYKHLETVGSHITPTSICYTCGYYARCKRDLWRLAKVNGGLMIVPLPCFADHPSYRAEEWRQRVEG